MLMFHSNEWAPVTSQLLSGQHRRSQMIVPIHQLRRIPIKELLVRLVTREVLVTEVSKHHSAIVQAVPAQGSN